MTTKSITAKVSQGILQNAQFLFNQSPTQTLQELLQNCRRAGATGVKITVAESGAESRVVIHDDGVGIDIEDADKLIHLGDPAKWDETTQYKENPAGMGFFSLCHLKEDVTVRSRDWEMQLTPEVFQGKASADVKTLPGASSIRGLQLSFVLPRKTDEVLRTLVDCLRFYPIPTTVNGKAAEQMDYLSDALFIHEIKGGRIGLYRALPYNRGYYVSRARFNFHGVTVVGAPFGEPSNSFTAIVDVKDTRLLDLVLPARTEVVDNRKLKDLRAEVRKAVYRCILSLKEEHHLAYADYQEAHQMGILIPEAEARLHIALPTCLKDSEGGIWCGPTPKAYASLPTGGYAYVTQNSIRRGSLSDADIAALHIARGDIPLLHENDEAKAGYSWYPAKHVASLTQVLVAANGKKTEIKTEEDGDGPWDNAKQETHPKAVTLKLELCGRGKREILEFPTCMAFTEGYDYNDALQYNWIPVKDRELTKVIDTGLLQSLFFCPSDERDYDPQQEEFEKDAGTQLTRVFAGDGEARLQALRNALFTYELRMALSELNVSSITLKVAPGNYPAITIAKINKRKATTKGKAKK